MDVIELVDAAYGVANECSEHNGVVLVLKKSEAHGPTRIPPHSEMSVNQVGVCPLQAHIRSSV